MLMIASKETVFTETEGIVDKNVGSVATHGELQPCKPGPTSDATITWNLAYLKSKEICGNKEFLYVYLYSNLEIKMLIFIDHQKRAVFKKRNFAAPPTL